MKPLYLDIQTLCVTLALAETTIQRMVRIGEFPPPRKLSGRRVGWLVSEVEEWAETRPVSDLLPPMNTSGRRVLPALHQAE